jgi:predicted unusual protein kinase regulating ubiquinone biosynthesis (AarF/ABC1/UbiB family)
MLDEVDFTKEAAHLAQFDAYLDRAGLRGVATCPGIYRQFSSQRVMVMDRLRGVPLTDLAAVRSVTSGDAMQAFKHCVVLFMAGGRGAGRLAGASVAAAALLPSN